MSYDEIVKSILIGEKIYNLPLRVTFYARVSTDSDYQLNSLDNQIDYYINFIKSKSCWTFIDGYIDEGVTGVNVDKRTCFKKMIMDAKLNKFDLIITKEVSRFARDLEDSIHYIRELKSSGVGVFFENQNINTFDDNSELILNIMFNLAQDESRKLSSRIKFGHKRAIEKGHVLGSSNITGYKKDNCRLIIIEEEAIFIRKVFELYATGEYGFYKLSKKLGELGYYNKKGKLYDKDSLKRIISNPKYKGYYRAHTYEITDYRTKKRKKIPIEEQIFYKCKNNEIPPIVSEELWDNANEILKLRTMDYKNNNYWSGGLKYPFSSKIFCMEHNTNFQRSHGSKNKNRPTWTCSLYQQFRIDACSSPIISESDLYNIIYIVLKKILPKKNIITEELFELYKNINKDSQYDIELDYIDKNIKKIEDKKSLALDLVFNGDLKRNELKKQFEMYEVELNNLLRKQDEITKQIKILNEKNNNTNKIVNSIQLDIGSNLLEDFIRKFVDKIIVSKINNDRNNIKLDIFLNLFSSDKTKTKKSKHIDEFDSNEYLYLSNQIFISTNKSKSNFKRNKYIYNVYIIN